MKMEKIFVYLGIKKNKKHLEMREKYTIYANNGNVVRFWVYECMSGSNKGVIAY